MPVPVPSGIRCLSCRGQTRATLHHRQRLHHPYRYRLAVRAPCRRLVLHPFGKMRCGSVCLTRRTLRCPLHASTTSIDTRVRRRGTARPRWKASCPSTCTSATTRYRAFLPPQLQGPHSSMMTRQRCRPVLLQHRHLTHLLTSLTHRDSPRRSARTPSPWRQPLVDRRRPCEPVASRRPIDCRSETWHTSGVPAWWPRWVATARRRAPDPDRVRWLAHLDTPHRCCLIPAH